MRSPEDRKADSIRQLEAAGIPVLSSLPLIESSAEVELRSAREVAQRALCCALVADISQGFDGADCIEYLEAHDLIQCLSPAELKFVFGKRKDEQQAINFSWRLEAGYVLLWALGKIDAELDPSRQPEPAEVYSALPPFNSDPAEYFSSAKLLDVEKILDQCDLIYRLHWAVRDHRTPGRGSDNLNASVIREWHYALNWLIRYQDQDWDDVTTDT